MPPPGWTEIQQTYLDPADGVFALTTSLGSLTFVTADSALDTVVAITGGGPSVTAVFRYTAPMLGDAVGSIEQYSRSRDVLLISDICHYSGAVSGEHLESGAKRRFVRTIVRSSFAVEAMVPVARSRFAVATEGSGCFRGNTRPGRTPRRRSDLDLSSSARRFDNLQHASVAATRKGERGNTTAVPCAP